MVRQAESINPPCRVHAQRTVLRRPADRFPTLLRGLRRAERDGGRHATGRGRTDVRTQVVPVDREAECGQVMRLAGGRIRPTKMAEKGRGETWVLGVGRAASG